MFASKVPNCVFCLVVSISLICTALGSLACEGSNTCEAELVETAKESSLEIALSGLARSGWMLWMGRTSRFLTGTEMHVLSLADMGVH